MGIDYYLFAAYIFLLVCAVLVLSKYLFSDVKRQKKMLDEMETKLLRTYQSLEDVMDEFYDLVAESKKDFERGAADIEERFEDIESRLSSPVLLQPERDTVTLTAQAVPQPAPKLPQRQRKSGALPPDQLAFEQLFNEITAKTGAPLSTLHEKVLDLSTRGLSRAEIAKELKITQNEVELVVGMNKSAAEAK